MALGYISWLVVGADGSGNILGLMGAFTVMGRCRRT